MESTKWTDHKERGFTSNYLLIFETFVSVEEPHIRSWFDVPTSQMSTFKLFVSAWVLSFVSIFKITQCRHLFTFCNRSNGQTYAQNISQLLPYPTSASVAYLQHIWFYRFNNVMRLFSFSLKQLSSNDDAASESWLIESWEIGIRHFLVTSFFNRAKVPFTFSFWLTFQVPQTPEHLPTHSIS